MTLISHLLYMATTTVFSPWVLHVPNFSMDMSWWCGMHVKELGILRDACASVIGDWLQRKILGTTSYACQLDALTTEWRDFCKSNGYQPVNLRLSVAAIGWSSSKSAFPEMLSVFKAIHIKKLLVFLVRRFLNVSPLSPFAACVSEFQTISRHP